MEWFLLVVSIAITLAYNLIRNSFSKHSAKSGMDFQVFNLACSTVSALVLAAAALITEAPAPSWYTLLLGLVFGVVTALAALFSMRALERGPASYTTLIVTSSMMIPALSGWMFFNEPLGWVKLAGMVLMLLSVLLSVGKDGGERRASLKWLIMCLLAMLFTGLVGVLQKVHQSSAHSGELMYFLVVAFAVSAVYSAVALPVCRAKHEQCSITLSPRKAICWMALASGVTIAFANVINLYLSGVMESIVFFPTVNGANLLLMLLVSVLFLKERLSARKWLGFAVGCGAIALLCFG